MPQKTVGHPNEQHSSANNSNAASESNGLSNSKDGRPLVFTHSFYQNKLPKSLVSNSKSMLGHRRPSEKPVDVNQDKQSTQACDILLPGSILNPGKSAKPSKSNSRPKEVPNGFGNSLDMSRRCESPIMATGLTELSLMNIHILRREASFHNVPCQATVIPSNCAKGKVIADLWDHYMKYHLELLTIASPIQKPKFRQPPGGIDGTTDPALAQNTEQLVFSQSTGKLEVLKDGWKPSYHDILPAEIRESATRTSVQDILNKCSSQELRKRLDEFVGIGYTRVLQVGDSEGSFLVKSPKKELTRALPTENSQVYSAVCVKCLEVYNYDKSTQWTVHKHVQR